MATNKKRTTKKINWPLRLVKYAGTGAVITSALSVGAPITVPIVVAGYTGAIAGAGASMLSPSVSKKEIRRLFGIPEKSKKAKRKKKR